MKTDFARTSGFVRRVQETAVLLREVFGQEHVSVAHSRFLAPDRIVNDEALRERLGPPDLVDRSGTVRPQRHLVVARQVAEQSLDIDFDLMVTDLAPIELVLQRMGRLHRHERPDRPRHLTPPRTFITGVDWTADRPAPVSGSVRVYGRYLLLRSLAVLEPHLRTDTAIELPGHIASLVQAAYGSGEVGPCGWQETISAAHEQFDRQQAAKRAKADVFRLDPPGADGKAIVGWLDAGVGSLDDDAPKGRPLVRDTPAESIEVIVVIRRRHGALVTPYWLKHSAGMEIPVDQTPSFELAKAVAACTLSLPYELCDPDRNTIEELENRNFIRSWQDNPYLEGQLILDFDEECNSLLGDYVLHYDHWLGLTVNRVSQMA